MSAEVRYPLYHHMTGRRLPEGFSYPLRVDSPNTFPKYLALCVVKDKCGCGDNRLFARHDFANRILNIHAQNDQLASMIPLDPIDDGFGS